MATHGNALAGSLAATLEAIEIQKLLRADPADRAGLAAGREVLLDAASHAHSVTRLVRNRACRFSHERWALEPAQDLSLRAALALAGGPGGTLFVPEHRFVSHLTCARCGLEESAWSLHVSPGTNALPCPRCEAARPVRGFDLVERISAACVPAPLLERPLSERGLRPVEVFGVACGDAPARYFVFEAASGGNPVSRAPAATGLVVAGCGNIGSFLAPLLGRMHGVGHVLLCDPDRYHAGQLAGQDMQPGDAGRPKAEVQARRLRALRPDLPVEAVPARLETLPLGVLRGAIAVSCLDSAGARRRLAARAWRMGSPFVDAAVGGGASLLVRTNVYLPEADAPCFECAFEARDYESLDQLHPCDLVAQPGVGAAA